jgi:hypothetical protein
VAKFVVEIITPTRSKPATRAEDVLERSMLQSSLLTIVGQISNCGNYQGQVTGHGGVVAKFEYGP